MREIKFRMWSWIVKNKIGRMIYLPSPRTDRTAAEENRLMQYIGLKDKNGKEIYEGDIVKLKDNSIGIIEYNLNFLAFVAKEAAFSKHDESEAENKEIDEIIGNIYENLELLEKCEIKRNL